jgi:ribulose-bisphosphate carboxylase large chain
MGERFTATYLIETPLALERAARAMAGEQSTGTFLPLARETPELVARHGAAVEEIVALGEANSPALPGARRAAVDGRYLRGRVTLSWPMENIGVSAENLMATVLGNLTELGELSGVRLVGLTLPEPFVAAMPRPAFGIPGTRRLTGVYDRPLIGTIVKPSVGLTPQETGDLVDELVQAGLDFIKDDELIADPPYSPLSERIPAVMKAIKRGADRNGRQTMYAFNITGSVDDMRRRHDRVLAAGGSCVMVSVNWVGLAGVEALRRHAQLPIHGHRNGWGAFSRSPFLGLDFTVYQILWRLLGVDHLHVNGIGNKFCEEDESVIASARACLTPLLASADVDDRVMPVFSSAQTARQTDATYEAIKTVDLIYACGGGIIGHPGGAAAGCASIRQAWEATMAGVPLQRYAGAHPELAAALDAFASAR